MPLPNLSPDRLKPADFIALRSLAQSHWHQGRDFSWKFNRTWQSAHSSDRAMGLALEAADRLVRRGLAEETTCLCKASVIRLTPAGETLADTLNRSVK